MQPAKNMVILFFVMYNLQTDFRKQKYLKSTKLKYNQQY